MPTSPTPPRPPRVVAPPLVELRGMATEDLHRLRTDLVSKAGLIRVDLANPKRDDGEWFRRAKYSLARTEQSLDEIAGVLAERFDPAVLLDGVFQISAGTEPSTLVISYRRPTSRDVALDLLRRTSAALAGAPA